MLARDELQGFLEAGTLSSEREAQALGAQLYPGGMVSHGIIDDEHRMRRSVMRQREVELEGRRVDARIASLESLATQATLLAGFSYSVLRPDNIRYIKKMDGADTAAGVILAACSAASFCAALWVVYLTGYASIRARIAFLQGSKRRAVADSLEVLIETQHHARAYFDFSMASLVVSALVVIIDSTPTLLMLSCVLIFVFIGYRGAIHKRRIDKRLQPWIEASVPAPPGFHQFGECVDRLEAYVGDRVRPCSEFMAAHAQRLWGSNERQPLDDDVERAEDSERDEEGATRRGGPTAALAAPSAAHAPAPVALPPAVVRGANTSFSFDFRGWVYMSSGTHDALPRPAPRPSNRWYLVYSAPNLLFVYHSLEHADLAPAKPFKRVIQLSHYSMVRIPKEEQQFTVGIQAGPTPPRADEGADGRAARSLSSWYLVRAQRVRSAKPLPMSFRETGFRATHC